MPFVSDEQRKAAFANMRGGGGGPSGRSNYGGRGGNLPRPPKQKKPKKTKTPAPSNSNYDTSGYGSSGYAGNYTNGLPSYTNLYTNLPNTTQDIPPVLSGPVWLQGEDTFDRSDWETGPGGLIWNVDPEDLYGARPLTDAERLLLGIGASALIGWVAPGIFGISGLSAGTTTISTLGTQGGALAVGSLSIVGLPMTVNDSPSTHVEGLHVVATYPDLVSYLQSLGN